MNWLEIALIGAVLAGATAGTVLVVRQPNFWLGMGKAVFTALLPMLLKRMDPETEARWRDCARRGGKWNHRTKRCE